MQNNHNVWLVTAMKCAGVVVIGLFLYLGIEQYNENELNAIAKRTTETQKKLISLELETFKNTSDIIASLIFDEKTAALMARLYNGEENNVTVREKLLKRYAPIYRKLQAYEVEHLQFHLPDGTSFLRVHAPDKYGDSLLNFRSSLAMIVQSHKPLYGFEVGRYLDAYRAVYPIIYKHQYVGSVELSFTFCAMKRVLEKVSGGKTHYFLALPLAQIKENADLTQLSVYKKCAVDPTFVIRGKAFGSAQILRETGFRTKLLPYREFSAILKSRSNTYNIVSFLPLKLIDGSHGGYYIVIHEDTGAIASLLSTVQIAKIAIVLIVGVALLLILMIHIYRVRAYTANIDPLTGVFNRRGCMMALGSGDRRYALIFIDIDNFKRINDTYGHDKGDDVIKTVARIIVTHIRKDDIFCRYGGDEFLLFIANATHDQALIIAEKLRKHIEIHRFDGIDNVTVSIGIAIRQRNESIGSLISRADKNLYLAKKKGQNRVVAEEDREEKVDNAHDA